MNTRTLHMLVLLACVCLALPTHAERLADSELGRLTELQSKQPPDNKLSEYKKLKDENNKLLSQKNSKYKELDKLRNVEITNLKNDLDYRTHLENAWWHMEEDRLKILEGIDTNQGKVKQFNLNLSDFLSERVVRNNYTMFHPPVFKGDNVLRSEMPKCLVIDLTYRARQNIGIIGGEILTVGKGKVQFVILHPENGEIKLKTVGEVFEITDNDYDKNTNTFHKKLFFTENFQDMVKDDYYGVFVDSNIGLTYNAMGLSSAALMEMKEETPPISLPKIPVPDDKFKPKPTNENDAWKRFSIEQNVGRTYSFNLYGEIVSGE